MVVDLDPQFNASQYFVGVTKYENLRIISQQYGIFLNNIQKLPPVKLNLNQRRRLYQ